MKSFYWLTALFLFASTSTYANDAEEFATLSPEQALIKANEWYGTNKASVQVFPDKIVGKFPQNEVSIPITSKHLISIAPYLKHTHPCTFHVPTGCTGELRNVSLHITVRHVNSDKLVFDKEVTTGKNGFADIWLPKSANQYKVTINYQGQKSVTEVSTQDNAPTCITTMQLI